MLLNKCRVDELMSKGKIEHTGYTEQGGFYYGNVAWKHNGHVDQYWVRPASDEIETAKRAIA